MDAPPLPADLRAAAPGIGARLGRILTGLAAVVAMHFLRNPRLVVLIVPLWTRLNRAARRFDRLMARLAAGRKLRPARPGRPTARPSSRRARLPAGRGWLVAALGYHAAGHASQLDALLAEPETAQLLAAIPGAGRILRPLCHMLGIRPAALPPLPARPRKPPPAPATPARPMRQAPAPDTPPPRNLSWHPRPHIQVPGLRVRPKSLAAEGRRAPISLRILN
jgi:hypothetical protein